MNLDLMFFLNSILLGIGLAIDAFSVSAVNGLNEPEMKTSKEFLMASLYGLFQMLMPLIGWFCVHFIVSIFSKLEIFIPWIAFILLLYIGGKMLIEGIKGENEENEYKKLTFGVMIVQAIATSIDALSVGFTIEAYSFVEALISTFIIGVVTMVICIIGVKVGKKFGTKLSNKAAIIGGIILILIGLEILISSFF